MKVIYSEDVPGVVDLSERACGDCLSESETERLGLKTATILRQYAEEAETWEDTQSITLYRLQDGRVGVFEESSDSSGHG